MNNNSTSGAPNIRRSRHRINGGFSLIELLVGILISLIGSLVIFQVFAVSEGQKRTATSGADAQQSGSFAMFQLERILRGVGSGFARGDIQALWGCELRAFRGGAQILPATKAFPRPFNTIAQNVRVAPVLIHDGGGDNPDMITAMYGRADMLTIPVQVRGSPTATAVTLPNTVGIQQDDLLLAFESGKECTIVQATDDPVQVDRDDVIKLLPNPITLGGGAKIYNNPTTGLSAYSSNARLVNLGNASDDSATRPGFQLFGIDAKSQLVTHDLLNFDSDAATTAQPFADNIVNLQAAYGIDNTGDNVVDIWAPPSGAFSAASLTAGTPAAATSLSSIKAIRLAIVARSALFERDIVTGKNFTLFGDNPAIVVRGELTDDERHFRYHVFDVVIPLRNMLLIPN